MTEIDSSALQSAAMGVLEPLLRSPPDVDASAALADAIDHCALTARDFDLRGIGYLSAIIAPFLRRRALSTSAAFERDLIERWVGDLLSFCAGELEPEATRRLVDQLSVWPSLTRLPTEFAEMIIERLYRDAERIRAAELERDSATPCASTGRVHPQ